MITKFKIFELNEDEPKVGDYVKIKEGEYDDPLITDFFRTEIGKIIRISKVLQRYTVKFEKEIPNSIECLIVFSGDDFEEFSYDKDTLKIKIDSKKYNL